MKKIIKIISIFMVLAMLVSAFAACSKEGDTNLPTDTSTESNTDTEAVTDPPEPDNKKDVIKILNLDQFLLLVEALNKNPAESKGKTYRLMVDLDFYAGWDASVSEKLGKFIAPDPITEFPGINQFYGEFDGNGKTISGIYMVDSAEAIDNVAIFKDLIGGTIKNLTVNTAFIYDDGAKGAAVAGLVGTVSGTNPVIENVTVNSNVYVASDSVANVAGVVGIVEAENLTMTNVTFGGRVGNIAENLNFDSTSTAAVLGQMIADGGDKTITMTGCKANGAIHANEGAAQDAFCAKGASKLTKTDCTVTAPENNGGDENAIVEIYTVEEFKILTTLASNFEGKTVKLMNDMILNSDWTASATAPTDVWQGIAEFKGVFDGNGKIISGIYGENFIGTLNGGTVKNLLLLNSAFVSQDDANVGFIGSVNGGKVIDVYSEAMVSFTGSSAANVGGIAGVVSGASEFENVVFAGAVSANGKTADLIANGTATYKNILAIGTGATTAATGTCVLSEKKDAAFLSGNTAYADWSYSAYLEAAVPKTITEKLRFLKLEADTSWYNETGTVFEISTAEQLLGLSVLGQTNDFAGKTIKLMANINLNPTWNATTNVSSAGIVTFAAVPNNVWTAIPVFKGTFDGNGYAISGIFSYTDFEVPAEGLKVCGGFISELIGGEIKNLIVKNSLAYFESTTAEKGTTRIHIGGFLGHAVDSTLTTLFVDIDTWVRFDYHFMVGGMIGALGTDSEDRVYVGTIKDIVYAGTMGVVPTTSNVCTDSGQRSSNLRIGGMIGANLSWHNGDMVTVTMLNLAFTGSAYKPGSASGDDLLCYTSGGAYNNGIGLDNAGFYNSKTAWNPTDPGTNSPTTLDRVAENVLSNAGATGNTEDTYGAAGWKSVNVADDEAYENGAGMETILLPGSVVDMLVANNG